jgi:glycosyltransferase involved in cell wall biosynthesis
MKILVSSALSEVENSGAAGTLLAIGREWQRSGHEVDWVWSPLTPRNRIIDELVRLPQTILLSTRAFLRDNPDTDVVTISQPYADRAIRKLKREYPGTLFINRTHGWEARFAESQRVYGWGSPTGWAQKVLRPISQVIRARTCRRVAGAAHGVLTACGSDADWIRNAYNLPSWRVAAIPYGLNLAELPAPPLCRSRDEPPRIIYAGQYDTRKGRDVLEKVLPRLSNVHPNARLTFVVPDEVVTAVDASFRSSWGDRLTVSGWVPREALYEMFGNHDVLLFPTFLEGFGKVCIEALAMGCAVIGFSEGGLADMQSDACRTCPKGDTAGFEAILAELLSEQFDFQRLSREAIGVGRQRTWRQTADESIQFFEDLIQRKG